ncbi:hypothetical protein BMS3Abin03_00158 [bacterium BMS3Abin03]|nr:hypothetical protein BMS3Abin03_00158 [bacterium BMS3Abin03]
MNHNEYKKWIRLSLYGEINKDEQEQLNDHLIECDECKKELEQQKNLLSILTERGKNKVDDKILSEARAQLRGALKIEKQKGSSFINLTGRFFDFISLPYRTALAGAAILAIGIFTGYILFKTEFVNPVNKQKQANTEFSLTGSDVQINNISFIDSNPADGTIEFTFDAVKTISLKGSVDDPMIQNILTYSMLNAQNPGSRLNSINAMNSEKTFKFDSDVKSALITVVMTDKNPGVRREALKVLKKLPFDDRIKLAFLYVLTNDSVSGLRIEAINALADAANNGNKLNDSEVDLFKNKLRMDDNNYIRYKSKTILQEYN